MPQGNETGTIEYDVIAKRVFPALWQSPGSKRYKRSAFDTGIGLGHVSGRATSAVHRALLLLPAKAGEVERERALLACSQRLERAGPKGPFALAVEPRPVLWISTTQHLRSRGCGGSAMNRGDGQLLSSRSCRPPQYGDVGPSMSTTKRTRSTKSAGSSTARPGARKSTPRTGRAPSQADDDDDDGAPDGGDVVVREEVPTHGRGPKPTTAIAVTSAAGK